MGLSRDDVCVNWTPLYHDMGLVNNFLLCLVKGIPLAMLHTMDFLKRPGLWLRTLHEAGATHTWSPNFGFALAAQRVSDRELEGVRLEGVRAFWNAAERIHLETMVAFQRRFEPYGVRPAALKTNFGCAENVGGATFSDPAGHYVVEHVDREALVRVGLARPVAGPESDGAVSVVGVGRPCPGMVIDIVSRTGERLPEGRVGEIVLATPSRMSGYLGNARETRRALRWGGVATGDFGYLRDGELFWVGRTRERINLHGKKYDPSDFEKVLLGVRGLREGSFAVFGVDDPAQGTQRLVVISEVREGTGRSHDEIFEELREKLTLELGVTVSEVLLLPRGTMSKTSSGKRRHRFYRKMYQRGGLVPLGRWRKG